MKNLKVLMLNGSPHANGNTAVALREMEKVFMENGVAVETVLVGDKALRGCAACNGCKKTGKCVFDDVVNDVSPNLKRRTALLWQALFITPPRMRRSSPASTVSFTARRSTRR